MNSGKKHLTLLRLGADQQLAKNEQEVDVTSAVQITEVIEGVHSRLEILSLERRIRMIEEGKLEAAFEVDANGNPLVDLVVAMLDESNIRNFIKNNTPSHISTGNAEINELVFAERDARIEAILKQLDKFADKDRRAVTDAIFVACDNACFFVLRDPQHIGLGDLDIPKFLENLEMNACGDDIDLLLSHREIVGINYQGLAEYCIEEGDFRDDMIAPLIECDLWPLLNQERLVAKLIETDQIAVILNNINYFDKAILRKYGIKT